MSIDAAVNPLLALTENQDEAQVLLSLQGIRIGPAPSSGFGVYLVDGEDGEISTETANYLGSIAMFGLGHRHGSSHGGASLGGSQAFEEVSALGALRPVS